MPASSLEKHAQAPPENQLGIWAGRTADRSPSGLLLQSHILWAVVQVLRAGGRSGGGGGGRRSPSLELGWVLPAKPTAFTVGHRTRRQCYPTPSLHKWKSPGGASAGLWRATLYPQDCRACRWWLLSLPAVAEPTLADQTGSRPVWARVCMAGLTPLCPTPYTIPATGRIHLFTHVCTRSGRGVFVYHRVILVCDRVSTEGGIRVKTGP